MPGRPARRTRRVSDVVPATPGFVIPPTPGALADEDLDKKRQSARNASSFYASNPPRPAILGNPEASAMDVMKTQRGRVEFVSASQPLLEWAVKTDAKHGGVKPAWQGRPPRRPLTAQKAFLEDRRAALLAEEPDLKLLPYPEQIKLAMKDAQKFSDLPDAEQQKYEKFAQADQHRYEAECSAYEKLNPGWRAHLAKARAAAGSRKRGGRRGAPDEPPDAEELFIEDRLVGQDPMEAEEEADKARQEASEAWEAAEPELRAPYEQRAREAKRRYDERLAAWKQKHAARKAAESSKEADDAAESSGEEDGAASSGGESSDSEDEASAPAQKAAGRSRATRVSGAAEPAADPTPAAKKSGGKASKVAAAAAVKVTAAEQPEPTAVKAKSGAVAPAKGPKKVATTKAGKVSPAAAAAKQRLAAQQKKQEAAKKQPQSPKTPQNKRKAAAADANEPAKRTRSASKGQPGAAKGKQQEAAKSKQVARRDMSAIRPSAASVTSSKKAQNVAEGIQKAEERCMAELQRRDNGRAATFPGKPAALVGAKVRCMFETDEGPAPFEGTVTKYCVARINGLGVTPLWEVDYEDGDSGEMEWHELQAVLVDWPPPGM